MLEKVNDDNFQSEVLDSEQTVVIKVMSDWCGPCKLLGQTFEEIDDGEDFNNIKFLEMNVEEAVETCPKYAIRAIPTVLVFSKGEVIGKPRIGAMQMAQVVSYLETSEELIVKRQEEKLEEKEEEDVDNED